VRVNTDSVGQASTEEETQGLGDRDRLQEALIAQPHLYHQQRLQRRCIQPRAYSRVKHPAILQYDVLE
jgi:hypothetical protein